MGEDVIEIRRVSTKEQAEIEHAGLPRQKEANAKTINQFGLNLIHTYEIVDVSGASVLETPEFYQIRILLKFGKINGIVVSEMSRLFRPDNFRDYSLLQDIREAKAIIYMADGPVDMNTDTGTLVGLLKSAIAGNELSSLLKKMAESKECKRKRGEHPNNHLSLPIGVGYDRKSSKYFYNAEANKVKRLFDLFFLDNIQNYRELERMTGLHHRNIPNLLKNELYIGYRKYDEKRGPERRIKTKKTNKGKQADRKKIKRAPEEIVRVKVIEKALIDENMFYGVQEILRGKRQQYHRMRPKKGTRFLLTGFAYCAECKNIMYSTSGGRNHKKDYYLCRSKNYTYVKKNGKSECSSTYIPRLDADETVVEFIGSKIVNLDYMKNLINIAHSNKSVQETKRDIEDNTQELSLLKRKRKKLLDLYIDSDDLDFSREVFSQKERQLKVEIDSIEHRLKVLKAQATQLNLEDMLQSIKSIAITLTEFAFWTPAQKREFMRMQCPKVYLTKDGISGITLNFCKMGSLMGTGSWLPPA